MLDNERNFTYNVIYNRYDVWISRLDTWRYAVLIDGIIFSDERNYNKMIKLALASRVYVCLLNVTTESTSSELSLSLSL